MRAWQEHRDPAAARELFEAHHGFILAIASRYGRSRVPVADLVSEGHVGLLVALDRFEVERGLRLVTYASYWIRARIVDHVLKSWSIVGSGSRALRSKVFFRLRRERARLHACLGDDADVAQELAERMGLSSDEVRSMLGHIDARDVSLDAPLFEDGAGTVGDTIPTEASDQEALCAGEENRSRARYLVGGALAGLDPRERAIVEQRLMADDGEELSLAELGRLMGVSRERARQIEERAKRKLKRGIERMSRAERIDLAEIAAA